MLYGKAHRETVVEDWSARLARARKDQGKSQAAVAEHAGMRHATYVDWEKGHVTSPDLARLEKAATYLNVTLHDILFGPEEPVVEVDSWERFHSWIGGVERQAIQHAERIAAKQVKEKVEAQLETIYADIMSRPTGEQVARLAQIVREFKQPAVPPDEVAVAESLASGLERVQRARDVRAKGRPDNNHPARPAGGR